VVPGLDEKIISDPDGYNWAVYCAQPTKYGGILAFARTPDAVLNGRKDFPRKHTTETLWDPLKREAAKNANTDELKAYPLMDWWMLDLQDGRIYRAASPINVPTKFDSVVEQSKFVFHFNPAGNLVFPLIN
jgi:hypothetical protein